MKKIKLFEEFIQKWEDHPKFDDAVNIVVGEIENNIHINIISWFLVRISLVSITMQEED